MRKHIARPLVATGVPSELFVLLFVANAVCCAVGMIPTAIAISVDSTFFILTETWGGKRECTLEKTPQITLGKEKRKLLLFILCVLSTVCVAVGSVAAAICSCHVVLMKPELSPLVDVSMYESVTFCI